MANERPIIMTPALRTALADGRIWATHKTQETSNDCLIDAYADGDISPCEAYQDSYTERRDGKNVKFFVIVLHN
jgi:hypothetical protein